MSDDIKSNFQEDIAKAALLEKKIADLREDEIEIRRHKAQAQKAKIDEAKRNASLMESMNFGSMTEEEIAHTVKESDDYIDAAQISQTFVDRQTFEGVVPLFRKNLIFIGAKTGEGKSTAIANIVRQLIAEVNPVTKKRKRVLVLTNEERKEDFFNRVTCLIHGWNYTNHDKFTQQQKKIFGQYIRLLSNLITVIDDSHGGAKGMTTSPEGIAMIFEGCIKNQEIYDAVLLDYYQNVTFSQVDITLNQFQAQEKLATLLDHYKNVYPAPIVVMGQITPAEEGKETDKPFEYRIKGRKQILVVSTFAMEMIAERNLLRTTWIIHKGRFSEEVGKAFQTGFKQGKFVYYGQEFKEYAMKEIDRRNKQALNRKAGFEMMKITKEELKDAEVQKETSSDRSTPVDSGKLGDGSGLV